MRDFASCFSEHAIKVSDTSCSGSSSSSNSGRKSSIVDQSVQTAITSLYRSRLAAHKDVLIKVTWSKTHMGPMLSLGVHSGDRQYCNPHILRKKKGTRSYVSNFSAIGLYWDYSNAKFSNSPEPVSNFYAVIVVDAELVLMLGDLTGEYLEKFEEAAVPIAAESSLVSRREQVLGRTVYSTRARFSEGGKEHEIVIRCCKGDEKESSELVVCVDRKKVVHVGRLHWNFRGNQTIFIDGGPVDVMWDVGGLWFSSPPGHAVFMFRKRSALQSRLWLEEEEEEKGMSGFSLLIQAFKNHP